MSHTLFRQAAEKYRNEIQYKQNPPTCKQSVAEVAITIRETPLLSSFLQRGSDWSVRSLTFERLRRVSGDCDCEWWNTMKCHSTILSKCVKGKISTKLWCAGFFFMTVLSFSGKIFFRLLVMISSFGQNDGWVRASMCDAEQIFNLGIGKIGFSCHREISWTGGERKCGVCPAGNSTRFGSPGPVHKSTHWSFLRGSYLIMQNFALMEAGNLVSCFFSSSKTGQVVLTSVSFDEADFANPLGAMLSGEKRVSGKKGVCAPALQFSCCCWLLVPQMYVKV